MLVQPTYNAGRTNHALKWRWEMDVSGVGKVGFIGLGAMGMAMAKQLLAAGFCVSGNDIRQAALDELAAAGGTVFTDAAGVGRGANLLFVMVFDAGQIEEVLFASGVLDTLEPESTIITCSTVAPSFVRGVAGRIAAMGHHFIDGPVSGGVPGAIAGELTMMAAGSEQAFAKARPALDVLTSKVYRLSDKPGVGSYVKAVNQLLAGVHVAVAAEAIALGTRAGADPHMVYEVIRNSAGTSVLFDRKVPQMLSADFMPPKSSVEIWVKDLGAVLDAGRELRFPLPMTSVAHQLYLAVAAGGHGQEDYASVVKFFEKLADISVSEPHQGE